MKISNIVFIAFLLSCLVFTGCSNNRNKDISKNNPLDNEKELDKYTSENDTIDDERYNSAGAFSLDNIDENMDRDYDDLITVAVDSYADTDIDTDTDTDTNTDKNTDTDTNTHADENTDTYDVDSSKAADYSKLAVYYVINNGVRMREYATLESDIILQLDKGKKVKYIDRKGDWFKVKYNNEIGYIRNDLLDDIEPIQQLTEDTVEVTSNLSEIIDITKIVVKKADRTLQLWDGDKLWNSYPIGLGWEPLGDKQREGDGRTPEGVYYVCARNRFSRFYLSLGISYPNIEDAKEALESGLINESTYYQIEDAISSGDQPPWNTSMGGEIMIHGHGSSSDWTAGCIAVEDDIMDIIWENCSIGTTVIIEP